jgi:peptidoglycan hydrolase-like protein with peptidoglycan-binding domain
MWWLVEQILALDPADMVLGGVYALKSGYHSSRADNRRKWPNDYSIRHAEDLAGPDDKTAAFDITFRSAQRSDFRNIAKYSSRLMASSKNPNDPRLDGWREWFGNTDLDLQVEGYDNRGLYEKSSDSSHRWHIHQSCDRCNVNNISVMRANLSVWKGETVAQWRGTSTTDTPAPAPTYPRYPGYVIGYNPSKYDANLVTWQGRMKERGWTLSADGYFGQQTLGVVKGFQRDKGLQVDGLIGERTWTTAWSAPIT